MRQGTATGFSLIGLWLLGSTVLAATYQWRDENGQLHFSDKPPANQQATDISEQLKNTNIDEGYQKVLPELERIQRRLSAEAAVQKDQSKDNSSSEIDQACQQARRELRVLQGRVAFFDESGNQVKVTESERQRMASELQSDIEEYCP